MCYIFSSVHVIERCVRSVSEETLGRSTQISPELHRTRSTASSMWVSQCGVRAGEGGKRERERGEGQKARQQLTPRCVCHSACLHGDTLACPASACHLFRCNTTTVFPTETPPLQTFFLLLEKNQKQTEKWKHQNESIHREKKEKKKEDTTHFPIILFGLPFKRALLVNRAAGRALRFK